MAANKLTPEQDINVRSIFRIIADDPTLMSKQSRSKIISTLLKELNYTMLSNGKFIDRQKLVTVRFGSTDMDAYECEWAADEEKALEAIANNDTVEASSGSETTDTEVREAVLPEDVL